MWLIKARYRAGPAAAVFLKTNLLATSRPSGKVQALWLQIWYHWTMRLRIEVRNGNQLSARLHLQSRKSRSSLRHKEAENQEKRRRTSISSLKIRKRRALVKSNTRNKTSRKIKMDRIFPLVLDWSTRTYSCSRRVEFHISTLSRR